MNLNTLQSKTKRMISDRIGRGGKRGKTSGRGVKGQRAHGDHGVRPELRDAIKKLPKRRGYGKNRGRTHVHTVNYIIVNLARLESVFDAGTHITPASLAEKGMLGNRQSAVREIKVLGNGDLTKKFTLEGFFVSASAQAKIEKAGGKVI